MEFLMKIDSVEDLFRLIFFEVLDAPMVNDYLLYERLRYYIANYDTD